MRGGVGVAFATGSFGGLEFRCGGNHGIPRELPNSRTPGSGSNGRGVGALALADMAHLMVIRMCLMISFGSSSKYVTITHTTNLAAKLILSKPISKLSNLPLTFVNFTI